ncbi:cytochrome P450 [Vararia minispora EC-137]|uniref:Cytochrome P450 n=1 Tax=Vararia minispora EC-137 TaxID=1314806 RepID=A0ACB8QKW1_9AGAM|nr:cytochrome P450 [Vararia minispora EC-137]
MKGHQKDIRYQNEVGDLDFKWMDSYGSAWRVAGCFGQEQLMIVDPKAIHHIVHASGYDYPKKQENRQGMRLLGGRGMIWSHGERHQRQRKILNPAFTTSQIKSFLPIFIRTGMELVGKLKEEVVLTAAASGLSDDTAVINVVRWLSHTTLDAIGEAGFNLKLGALNSDENELTKVYHNLFLDSTLYPPVADIIFKHFWAYIPEDILNWVRYIPTAQYRRFRQYLDHMRRYAKELIRGFDVNSDGKDVLSLLLRANASQDPESRVSDDELFDLIPTMLLAGHDTTAMTLVWFLWELAKDIDFQTKVREEIAATRKKIVTRGGKDLEVADLDSMVYLHAAMKESMRIHTIAWEMHRTAGTNDVIPLAFPITTKSGKTLSGIPVSKGQNIAISMCGYNRVPEVWGEDAHVWNPYRFLDEGKTMQTGKAGGLRGCIGVIEMQTIAIALLENFQFTVPPEPKDRVILRKPATVMSPMNEHHQGSWLGLSMRIIEA